jgi:hypothetical protein
VGSIAGKSHADKLGFEQVSEGEFEMSYEKFIMTVV